MSLADPELVAELRQLIAGRVLDRFGKRSPPRISPIDPIVSATAEAFGVTPKALLGRRKNRSALEARLCAYYVARRCTRLSYPELGRAFGRDHSTVLSAVQRMGALVARDPWLGAAVAELCERFGEIEEEREQ